MERHSQPLAILYGYRKNRNELNFVGRKGIISLSGRSKDIEKILRLCNGMNSVQDIINQLPSIGQERICELLSLCEDQGIVRESRNLFAGFHEDSSNPLFFSYDHGVEEINRIMSTPRLRERNGEPIQLSAPPDSNLFKTIEKRLTVRQFREAKIPLDQLSGLLRATYGVGKNGHWSVPSGGALYPLDLYLIVPREGQCLPPGVYRWEPEKLALAVMPSNNPLVWITKVFNTNDLLKNAACILCIAANFDRMISKYASRGYLLTLLEAGHAAQNTSLYCAEQNIGSVECCGFCDELLARELGLQFPQESVITTLILGIPEHTEKIRPRVDHEMADKAYRLKRELVGSDKPIADIFFWEPKIKGHSLSQWGAVATYRPTNGRLTASVLKDNRGFATGSTTNEAVVKAIAEGFERYALQQYRSDLTETAINLVAPFLDPRATVPYMKSQYKMLGGVEPFNPKKRIDW
ncbi:MAG: SagB family peptide dehydrogenase [Parcubacteria group bacterium]|nr:SagB family peptide dehydrogenase [Parcubacteria group bacterium]